MRLDNQRLKALIVSLSLVVGSASAKVTDLICDTVGEAETWDFLANRRNEEARAAASALDQPWSEEASDWLSAIEGDDRQVAIWLDRLFLFG